MYWYMYSVQELLQDYDNQLMQYCAIYVATLHIEEWKAFDITTNNYIQNLF